MLRVRTVSACLLVQVVANGSCHSIEGIKLEELGLKTGEAKLLVRGNLLGAAQDASIILTDFPVAILQPVFRALPALEHAAPAVAASGDMRCLALKASASALPRLGGRRHLEPPVHHCLNSAGLPALWCSPPSCHPLFRVLKHAS